jgi:hypothetical protein
VTRNATEEGMRIRKALLGAAGSIAILAAGPASAEVLTWHVTSQDQYIVHVQFFSQTYDRVWPGADRVWVIDDYAEHTYRLECTPGEKICIGAAEDGDYSTYWGVGLDNDKSCSNCCATCGGGAASTVLNN